MQTRNTLPPATEIIEKVNYLCGQPMRKDSHGYEKYQGMSIGQAVEAHIEQALAPDRNINAAIALMDVVLAANRAYNRQVKPHIDRVKRERPELKLADLAKLLERICACWLGHYMLEFIHLFVRL